MTVHLDDEAAELAPAGSRVVLLDDKSEREWRATLGARAVIACRGDGVQEPVAWLEAHLRARAAQAAGAAWAGEHLDLEAGALLEISAPLRADFAAKLAAKVRHRAWLKAGPRGVAMHDVPDRAEETLRRAACLCARVLGWLPPGELDAPADLAAWAVIAPRELPALLLDARGDLAAALARGDELALAGWPIALRATPVEWGAFLASDGWDRPATRWRSAEVLGELIPSESREIPSSATAQLIGREAPAAAPLLAETAARIAREKAIGADAVSPEARSAAEALLHAVLEARPLTRGRFALNTALDFAFGLRAAEGDLVAAGARLVVEIDGYYHFRDTAGYRRDRRKDAALQEHGWFVLRFLADDVVCDLEDVVARIETQLARRDLARPVR